VFGRVLFGSVEAEQSPDPSDQFSVLHVFNVQALALADVFHEAESGDMVLYLVSIRQGVSHVFGRSSTCT